MKSISIALFSFALITTARAATVDNGVIGEPEIECGHKDIILRVSTQKAFEGHIYVKGHYDDLGCRQPATLSREASLSVNFNTCGVRRERRANPKGVFLSMTVVVTFHPMFITMVDKAYNVRCFYMEADKTVNAGISVSLDPNQVENIVVMFGPKPDDFTSILGRTKNQTALGEGLDVSMLSTALITRSIPMPTCTYQVLQKQADGPPVRFATVGQQVYHLWSCEADSAADGIFCMEVHSCFVNDERKQKVQLLDENGCTPDKYLFGQLEYTEDLQGGQQSMVFKFADRNALHFECQIRLTIKEGDRCVRQHESCPAEGRVKRSVSTAPTEGENVDVYSETITVIDIDEPIKTKLNALEVASLNRNYRRSIGKELMLDQNNTLCLSSISFGILVAVLIMVLLASMITVTVVCMRKQTEKSESLKSFS